MGLGNDSHLTKGIFSGPPHLYFKTGLKTIEQDEDTPKIGSGRSNYYIMTLT